MKRTVLIAAAAALVGCASPAPSTGDLMKLPQDKVLEAKFTAAVPISVAYRNVRDKARKCWTGEPRHVEADPFDPETGYARVGLRVAGSFLMDTFVVTAVDLFPDGDKSTRLVGKVLLNSIAKMPGHNDMANLQQWAEGKDVPCA